MYLTCITITQSTINTSPIWFDIGSTNVDARLKQRCINVVPRLCNVVSTLCNVVSTLLQRRVLTLHQRCTTLKIRRRILFHFQRRINVISTTLINFVSTLIRRWNIGWEANKNKYTNFQLIGSIRNNLKMAEDQIVQGIILATTACHTFAWTWKYFVVSTFCYLEVYFSSASYDCLSKA